MHFAHRLQLAAVITALFSAQTALAQNNSIVPLKAQPSHVGINDLTYKTLGLVGSKESTTYRMNAALRPPNPSPVPGIPDPGFYPGDLSNPDGGPTVLSTRHHPIYVNAAPSTWGDVPGFLTDYGKSRMIHLVDQYIGSSDNNRYRMGIQFLAGGYPVPANNTLGIDDILNLVYAGASISGNGYGHLYHVFLPPGVDMCLSGPPVQCYSPDNPNTWYFCAFHGSVTFSGAVGHVLFSVEPYQDVVGCSVPPTGTGSGQLTDSTDNVLSHEVTETITDPDGDASWVHAGTALFGGEIGDVCVRSALFPDNNPYWDYGIVRLNGHPYTIQPEYSNQAHGCAYSLLSLSD